MSDPFGQPHHGAPMQARGLTFRVTTAEECELPWANVNFEESGAVEASGHLVALTDEYGTVYLAPGVPETIKDELESVVERVWDLFVTLEPRDG